MLSGYAGEHSSRNACEFYRSGVDTSARWFGWHFRGGMYLQGFGMPEGLLGKPIILDAGRFARFLSS